MPVTYGSKLHILPVNCHLLAVQQEPYTNASLNEKYWSIYTSNTNYKFFKHVIPLTLTVFTTQCTNDKLKSVFSLTL